MSRVTKNKLIEILAFLGNTYRNFNFPKSNDDATRDMIDDWSEFIKEYEYENARQGVINWAKDNPSWPPNAPQLMHEIKDIERKKELEEHAKAAEKIIEEGAPDPDESVNSMSDARDLMGGSQ